MNSTEDALHAEDSVLVNAGNIEITTSADAIQAARVLNVEGGKINVKSCNKGFKALNLEFGSGEATIVSLNDSIDVGSKTEEYDVFGNLTNTTYTKGTIEIAGGTIILKPTDLAINLIGDLEILDGDLIIYASASIDKIFSCVEGSTKMLGGSFYALCQSKRSRPFSSNSFKYVRASVGYQGPNTPIIVKNSENEVVASITPDDEYAYFLISNKKITTNDAYNVFVGGNLVEHIVQ